MIIYIYALSIYPRFILRDLNVVSNLATGYSYVAYATYIIHLLK